MGEFVMQHWHFVATQTACHLLIVPTENIIGKRLGAHRARIAENNRSCAVYILYIAVLRAESISFSKLDSFAKDQMITDGWFRAPSIISANPAKNPAVDYISRTRYRL